MPTGSPAGHFPLIGFAPALHHVLAGHAENNIAGANGLANPGLLLTQITLRGGSQGSAKQPIRTRVAMSASALVYVFLLYGIATVVIGFFFAGQLQQGGASAQMDKGKAQDEGRKIFENSFFHISSGSISYRQSKEIGLPTFSILSLEAAAG
jgi:hypothetical protein